MYYSINLEGEFQLNRYKTNVPLLSEATHFLKNCNFICSLFHSGDFILCLQARHFDLIGPLSTQTHKWCRQT